MGSGVFGGSANQVPIELLLHQYSKAFFANGSLILPSMAVPKIGTPSTVDSDDGVWQRLEPVWKMIVNFFLSKIELGKPLLNACVR